MDEWNSVVYKTTLTETTMYWDQPSNLGTSQDQDQAPYMGRESERYNWNDFKLTITDDHMGYELRWSERGTGRGWLWLKKKKVTHDLYLNIDVST